MPVSITVVSKRCFSSNKRHPARLQTHEVDLLRVQVDIRRELEQLPRCMTC